MINPLDFIPAIDLIAFVCMVGSWSAYTLVADRLSWDKREVARVMHNHRIQWMQRMLFREIRMPDVNIVVAHIRSGTLFASTTILIMAGIVAMLGNIDRLMKVVTELSFAADTSKELLELKVFVLLGVFVYAFFKFAWCLRQFNYALILIGAAPWRGDCDDKIRAEYPVRTARVLTRASGTFNRGLRAYYFGLATLTWFIQPEVFIAASFFVLLVLYRRDYQSQTLDALAPGTY
ncbi:MAG: DUF599 domain-containing protein [Rhodospirillales bacterium]|nr:DUF599 domain-containing protein [Rhodospirillales bacterium]